MAKRPSFQWYPGDWLRDTALRSCPIEARGLWADLLCLMHDGQPYGHLAVNGNPLTDGQVAPMVGLAMPRYRKLLRFLESAGVFSRSETGAVYSRRMVRDEEIRSMRQEIGKLGGNPMLLGQPPAQPKPPPPDKTQVKQMVATATEEVVGSSGGGVGEGVAGKLPEPYRDAYLGYRKAHRNPFALDKGLEAIENGMHPPQRTWAVIGRALHEMAAAGIAADFTPRRLQNYCEGIGQQPFKPRLERRGSLRDYEASRAKEPGEVA